MPKCVCGAEKVEKIVAGNGFGAISQTKMVCPNGCSNSTNSGWTVCHSPKPEKDNSLDNNPFLDIPGWRNPWQD